MAEDRGGWTPEEARAHLNERYDEVAADPPTVRELRTSAGTAHLPTAVVSQSIVLLLVHETTPENPRLGVSKLGITLGGRENPPLTPDEVEYVRAAVDASLASLLPNLRAETARLVEDNNRLAAKLSAASTAEPAMTAQDARELLAKKPCTHCGYLHPTTAPACPRIASVTFSADGNALAVRYWPHGQWPTEGSHPDELAAIIAAEQANSEIADE